MIKVFLRIDNKYGHKLKGCIDLAQKKKTGNAKNLTPKFQFYAIINRNAKTHTIKIMHLLRFKCEIFLHPFLFAPTHITFIIKKKIYSLVIDMYILCYICNA